MHAYESIGLDLSNDMKFTNFGGADLPEFACKRG